MCRRHKSRWARSVAHFHAEAGIGESAPSRLAGRLSRVSRVKVVGFPRNKRRIAKQCGAKAFSGIGRRVPVGARAMLATKAGSKPDSFAVGDLANTQVNTVK